MLKSRIAVAAGCVIALTSLAACGEDGIDTSRITRPTTTVSPEATVPEETAPEATTPVEPTTVPETTAPPTTVAPTTAPPTTVAPTTTEVEPAPTTTAPTPTTAPPTTAPPTTVAPTTAPPTTAAPTTAPPTTAAPTTEPPTTVAPTTVPEVETTTTTLAPEVPAAEDEESSSLLWLWILIGVVLAAIVGLLLAIRGRNAVSFTQKVNRALDEVTQTATHLVAVSVEGANLVASQDAPRLAASAALLDELAAEAPEPRNQSAIKRVHAQVVVVHGIVNGMALSTSPATPAAHVHLVEQATALHSAATLCRVELAPPATGAGSTTPRP